VSLRCLSVFLFSSFSLSLSLSLYLALSPFLPPAFFAARDFLFRFCVATEYARPHGGSDTAEGRPSIFRGSFVLAPRSQRELRRDADEGRKRRSRRLPREIDELPEIAPQRLQREPGARRRSIKFRGLVRSIDVSGVARDARPRRRVFIEPAEVNWPAVRELGQRDLRGRDVVDPSGCPARKDSTRWSTPDHIRKLDSERFRVVGARFASRDRPITRDLSPDVIDDAYRCPVQV